MASDPKRKVLAPVRPNVGIQAAYQKKLDRAIAAMSRAVIAAIARAYRSNPPELASDESPAMAFRELMDDMRRDWERRFDDLADTAGRGFAKSSFEHGDRAFASRLRDAGFTVKFKMSRPVNDAFQATISAQTALIKSIPAEYLTQVEGYVSRAVQNGRDLGTLTQDLQHQFGVTMRRAATIARDQNNKATATIVRLRQTEVGVAEAVWMHSHGGRHPRPTHVAMNGKTYEVAKGMWDPAEQKFVWPGELISCRCVARALVSGL